MKKIALALLGTAMQTSGEKMPDHQEVLTFTSDAITDAFIAESFAAPRAAGGHGRCAQGGAARSGRANRRLHGGPSSRSVGEGSACGDGAGRHAADAARGAPPLAQVNAGGSRQRAADPRG